MPPEKITLPNLHREQVREMILILLDFSSCSIIMEQYHYMDVNWENTRTLILLSSRNHSCNNWTMAAVFADGRTWPSMVIHFRSSSGSLLGRRRPRELSFELALDPL